MHTKWLQVVSWTGQSSNLEHRLHIRSGQRSSPVNTECEEKKLGRAKDVMWSLKVLTNHTLAGGMSCPVERVDTVVELSSTISSLFRSL